MVPYVSKWWHSSTRRTEHNSTEIDVYMFHLMNAVSYLQATVLFFVHPSREVELRATRTNQFTGGRLRGARQH